MKKGEPLDESQLAELEKDVKPPNRAMKKALAKGLKQRLSMRQSS